MADVAPPARFFKVAACCAFAVAAIVLAQYALDWLVPPPSSPEGEIAAMGSAAGMAAQVLPLAGIPMNVVALWAVTLRKWGSAPGRASVGFIFVLFWGALEIAFRGVRLFGATRWALRYRDSPSAAREELLRQILDDRNVAGAVLLTIFCLAVLIGLLYGSATWRGRGIEKAVSVAFFLYALLALDFLAGSLLESQALSRAADASYLVIRSVDRALIGAWLWKT